MNNKAVFLDRDGVVTEPVFDIERNTYRAPWDVSEFELMPFVIESLKELRDAGYYLFLVSNQPDADKGLVKFCGLIDIKYHLINILAKNKIFFKGHCYCFHHPSRTECVCRKPSPYFLLDAAREYHIDLKESWMVGDRDSDIQCGKNAGTKTIQIGEYNPIGADHLAGNIKEAVDIILRKNE